MFMHASPMLVPSWENAAFWWRLGTNSFYGFTRAYANVAFPPIQAVVVIALILGHLRSTEENSASELPTS